MSDAFRTLRGEEMPTVTRPALVKTWPLTALLVFITIRICTTQTTSPYQPPAKSVKLSAEASATLARAKTAALVAVDVARLSIVAVDARNKTAVVALPGGIRRAVDVDKAKSELLESMRKWNRFAIVDDPEQADIVVVVFEDTVEPSRFSKANGDRKHRMRERLAVYAVGRPASPLWADEERESTFGALTGSPVGKVVDKLREDVERASRR